MSRARTKETRGVVAEVAGKVSLLTLGVRQQS
jgi:hypothetical protein